MRKFFRRLFRREPKHTGPIYPKAQAPLTWAVYEAANARAQRWLERHDAVRKERDALAKRVKELEEQQ